jgi:glutaredoxin
MNQKLVTVSVVIIMLVIAGGIIFFKNFQGSTIEDTPSEKVAKWIGDHSILYVQAGCVHCKEQEDLFGGNVKYLTILDGIKPENRQKFIDAGIEGTPTWIINNQKYVGVQSIEKLKELTGYQD